MPGGGEAGGSGPLWVLREEAVPGAGSAAALGLRRRLGSAAAG